MKYPTIGYFENETFRPTGWVPTYPNPAMERLTNLDAYWGAKIVMAFTDEQIRAIVGMGYKSNADAAEELSRLIIERRDMIGRFWFARVNPLDHLELRTDRLMFAISPSTEDSRRRTARATTLSYWTDRGPLSEIGRCWRARRSS